MGNSKFEPPRGRGWVTGVFSRGYVENKGVRLAPQVGFGSEHSIDNIGSYWFYCNASDVFVQKCPLCTTDLSHVTGLQKELPRRRSGRAPIVPTVIVLASADTSCHPR